MESAHIADTLSSGAYDAIAFGGEATVVAEYDFEQTHDNSYQSEAALEKEFIETLQSQAYEYLHITNEEALIANLRTQLEKLNNYTFSDSEWERFFTGVISNPNSRIQDKAVLIQEDHIQNLTMDDGSTKNIRLIDKKNIHNNHLQVINQYVPEGGAHDNRYDVTILVNGLPLVHIELKRRGVALKEAFNQINRYARESFWAGSGLFEYVQIFVISNGTHTKYYSNTTRESHIAETTKAAGAHKKTSHSFKFTMWWADARNKPIRDLTAFTRTFFAKHTILNILTRYCVLTAPDRGQRNLLVMRPYQIVATERIIKRIEISSNYKKWGSLEAGGYIWHTTGSGKTLTSFKTAQLASSMEGIEKVLFVVDRKDLDYQTMKEYDRFQKGAADSSKSTAMLARQLANKDENGNHKNYPIIVTTIQKLSTFIKQNAGHSIYDGHIVIIFDECHRSQFGDMHKAITKAFKKYHIFGFTGTPIFAENSGSSGTSNPQSGRALPVLRTTEQAFGQRLHAYTIVDAIKDENVLPFRVGYVETIKESKGTREKVYGIDTEEAFNSPERISLVVQYILEHFAQQTKASTVYKHSSRRVSGFNSIMATSSIAAAKLYYAEFKRQQEELPANKRLKIAMIYSYAPNEAETESVSLAGGFLGEESYEESALAAMETSDRQALDEAMADYSAMFSAGATYDTSAKGFANYYKDLSDKLKNREIDLCIVVNMFLTGFDAPTLNTLWVDKNLRDHGLIQAFSRTNRILNEVKHHGNIVCFRNLEEQTNHALELFGNEDAHSIVILKPYGEYYEAYIAAITDLRTRFPQGEYPSETKAIKEFVTTVGQILKLRNILASFDEFAPDDPFGDGEGGISREYQDYLSTYQDIRDTLRELASEDKESIVDDLVFEMELVKQVQVDVSYILELVEKYRAAHGDGEDKEIEAQIKRAVASSPQLRDKQELIDAFVQSNAIADAGEDWFDFIRAHKDMDIRSLIAQENLNEEATFDFLERCFESGYVPESGADIAKILPKMSRFTPGGERDVLKARVLDSLRGIFNRYEGLIE